MTRTTRNLTLLAFAVVLIGLLLILVPNLQRIELQPGKSNTVPPAGVETFTPDLGSNPTGAGYSIFLQILFIAALGSLALIVIGAIFKKELRYYLIAFAIFFGLALGLYYLLKPGAERVEPDLHVTESPALQLMEDRPVPPVGEEAPMPPPGWSFTAVAILISIGVAVLLAIVWAKLAPRWRSRWRDDKSELEELVETVVSAADEIQLGGDPRSAVLRCYREMVRILCRNRSIDHVHMTARELADALHRVGFTAEHVDRLTEIFELVRYGNRGGRGLAEQAIGCLEAIREAYAT